MPNSNCNKNSSGCINLPNPHIKDMDEDVLYHLALSTKQHDLKAMFGDIKFVVVGGSPRRMEAFAHYMIDQVKEKLPTGQTLVNIAGKTDRYVLFKVGPVLVVSHGIGRGSFSIMMHELFKLMQYSGLRTDDVCIFRIGTSGGIGIPAGSVVITESSVDGLFRPYLEMAILGKLVKRDSSLDPDLMNELMKCGEKTRDYQIVKGKTMCTLDFYEGQARLDGAFCDYTKEDKFEFLEKAHKAGVCNIEMESLCFASMCHHANIKGAVVCVTLLDRLQGDQVDIPHDLMQDYDLRPAELVACLIRRRLGITGS